MDPDRFFMFLLICTVTRYQSMCTLHVLYDVTAHGPVQVLYVPAHLYSHQV
jgi:hypothetical protein